MIRVPISVYMAFAFWLSPLFLPSLAAGTPPDAGLNMAFQMPAPTTGATIDITTFGATAGDASDDDAVAINAALGAASPGDEVYIPNGVWHIKSRIDAVSGVAIRGESQSGAILRARFTEAGMETLTVLGDRSDITISALTLDSDGAVPPRFAMQIGRNGGPLTTRVHVRNLTIDTFNDRGIILRWTRHVKVEACTIRNATDLTGGFGYGVTIQQPDGDNNWVTGCMIGPVIRHGVLLQFSTHHNLVEYNTFIDNEEDAIDLHGEDEYSNEVRYNTITNCFRSAIGIGNTGSTHDAAGPNNWIHHNVVRYGYEGIEIIQESPNQFIENNDIRYCTNYGIRIHDGGGDDVLLRGNLIVDCDTGIYADDALGLVVLDNIVTDNDAFGIRTTSAVTGYSITGNDFSCNGVPSQLGSGSGAYSDNVEDGGCYASRVTDAFVIE